MIAAHRVVVTGAGGQLGAFLRTSLTRRGATAIGLGRATGIGIDLVADLTDERATRHAIAAAAADAVIHAGAYTDVDGCERDPARADAVNRAGSANVATAARDAGARLVMVSTDFVFAGDGGAPYAEDAPTGPLSVYGQSKLAGERAVLDTDPAFAIARTAWLYGGAGKHFPRTVLTLLHDHPSIEVVTDEVGSPTYAGDLAEAVVALVATKVGGVFHLTNAGQASRFELAREIARVAGLDPDRIRPTTSAAFLASHPLPARRPANSALANARASALGITLRPWREAVAAYVPALASELGFIPVDVHKGVDAP